MTDDLERRLDAVERAITGGDRAVADLADAAELSDHVDCLADRTDDIEERLADLEAAVRALRGYVGQERANGESRDGTEPQGSNAPPGGDDPSAPDDAGDVTDDHSRPHEPGDGGVGLGGATTERGRDDSSDDSAVTTGVNTQRAGERDDGTRRVDVDTGERWPDWDGDRPTSDQTGGATGGPGAAPGEDSGARDVRRLDPKPGGAAETTGRDQDRGSVAEGQRDDAGGASGESADEETVAWDWEWTTTDPDGAEAARGPESVGSAGGATTASRDGAADGPNTEASTQDGGDHRRRAESADGNQGASAQWTAGRSDAGGSSAAPWRDERVAATGSEPSDSTGSERRQSGESQGEWTPSRPTDRWPAPDDAEPVDDRRPGTSDDWPEGLDIERAQPWSVPDPPRVAAEEREDDDGLLERLREAL